MNWIPVVLLLLFSVCGYVCRRYFSDASTGTLPAKLAIVGYYAAGLLVGWVVVCWIRSLALVFIAPSWQVLDLMLSPVRLFPVEGLVLVGAVLVEFWFLKGRYDVKDECKATFRIGIRTAAATTILTTVVSIPVWWMIRPGEFGTFDGTVFHGLVTERAMAMFDTSIGGATSSVGKMVWSQNARAIPDAIVIAALLVCFIPLIRPVYRYFRIVLNDEYLHLPPKQKEGEQSPAFPSPRGKRVM